MLRSTIHLTCKPWLHPVLKVIIAQRQRHTSSVSLPVSSVAFSFQIIETQKYSLNRAAKAESVRDSVAIEFQDVFEDVVITEAKPPFTYFLFWEID